MKPKRSLRSAGFTMVEIIVAIAILGLAIAPLCTSLVLALRLNAKTDQQLRAELAVTSAVEELMSTGITDSLTAKDGVKIDKVLHTGYYEVTVTSEEDETVFIRTFIRSAP